MSIIHAGTSCGPEPRSFRPDRFDLDPSAIDRDDPVGPFRCQRVDLVARRHDGTDSVEQAVIQFALSRVNHRQPKDNATPPARSSSKE